MVWDAWFYFYQQVLAKWLKAHRVDV